MSVFSVESKLDPRSVAGFSVFGSMAMSWSFAAASSGPDEHAEAPTSIPSPTTPSQTIVFMRTFSYEDTDCGRGRAHVACHGGIRKFPCSIQPLHRKQMDLVGQVGPPA